MDFFIFIIAMTSLIVGADLLIDESEKIANKKKISPFIIGATLIALGTSLPEMVTSMNASMKGMGDIVISNVIGSTIFNIALVLGIVFLISKKMEPKRDLFAKDSSWALFPIFIFILMGLDGVISRFEGFLLLFLMVAYILFLFQTNQIEEDLEEELDSSKVTIKTYLLIILGLGMVVIGADYTIDSAKKISIVFGLSEWVIGMFLIAFGTSLPELVVGIKATLKNKADMAIGAIIGSNVANFSIVIGGSALINNLNVNFALNLFDILTALIVTLMLVFITANKLYNKSAGIVLLMVLVLTIHNVI
jgi:cation:H+ antiporter